VPTDLAPIPPDTPETPWIRTSERLTFTRCPQAWEWAYVDRLKPYTPSPALRFGSLIHVALEKFYKPGTKRGPNPADTFEQEYEKELVAQHKIGFRDDDGTWNEAGELGVAMMTAYLSHYGRDTRWRVLHTEKAFHMPVTNRVGRVIFVYVGVVDLIVEDRLFQFTGFVDHKTTGDNPTQKREALILDEQTGAYWSYGQDAGLLKKGVKLDGMIFNFMKKSMPDKRPKNAAGLALNKDGTVSKQQPTPMFHREVVYRNEFDGNSVRNRIRAQAAVMKAMREGVMPVWKTPGTLHNPHCKWCEFKDMCELHESGQDWEAFKKRAFVQHDPYTQHAIYDGEAH
jgi:hypothetical protein